MSALTSTSTRTRECFYVLAHPALLTPSQLLDRVPHLCLCRWLRYFLCNHTRCKHLFSPSVHLAARHALQIFFPRSVQGEIQSRHATREKSQSRNARGESRYSERDSYLAPLPQKRPLSALSDEPASTPLHDYQFSDTDHKPRMSLDLDAQLPALGPNANALPTPTFQPNRRAGPGMVIEGRVVQASPTRLTERDLAAHDEKMSGVHPFLHNFTSPIGASLSELVHH